MHGHCGSARALGEANTSHAPAQMSLFSTIRGTFWYFYYLTVGYFVDYERHRLVITKSKEVWAALGAPAPDPPPPRE